MHSEKYLSASPLLIIKKEEIRGTTENFRISGQFSMIY